MAKEESKRVMRIRERSYEQVVFLTEKGGRKLYRAIAKRDGMPVSEMIRQAILARAGLSMMPYPADLEKLDEAATAEQARQALADLQKKESVNEIIQRVLHKLANEPPETQYHATITEWDAEPLEDVARRIIAAIEKKQAALQLSGRELAALRRLIANKAPQRPHSAID